MAAHSLKFKPNETPVIKDCAMRALLGYNIKRAYMALAPAAQEVLANNALRLQTLTCLSIIDQNPGIAPSALAEYLRVERSNLVATIDELETMGLLKRERSNEDRRRFALYLTQAGSEKLKVAMEDTRRSETSFIAGLSAEDYRLLTSLLSRIESATFGGGNE